jgi:hypothetical protein
MIRIQWDASETSRDPDTGGDTLEVTVGELEIDATITEISDITAEATEHPVEEGANVTDHVRPGLLRIQLECVVSNTPTRPRVEGSSIRSVDLDIPGRTIFAGGAIRNQRSRTEGRAASTIPARVLTFATEFDRPVEVVDQLRDLMHAGTPVDILDLRLGDLEGWLLVGMSPEVAATDSVRFTLTAQELRTAVTEEVAAPSPRVERGRRQRQRGRQRGSGDGDGQTRRRSAARSIYDQLAEAGPLQGVLPQLQTGGS